MSVSSWLPSCSLWMRQWDNIKSWFLQVLISVSVDSEDGVPFITCTHRFWEIEMIWQLRTRVGQLSEVNVDPDTLPDMVSIMVNQITYKPSVKDIIDKYYEMFRGKNRGNKQTFSTVPRMLRTRTQTGELDLEEVGCWVVRSELSERETSLSFVKIAQSHLLRVVPRYAWIWVSKWGEHKCLGISSMLWENRYIPSHGHEVGRGGPLETERQKRCLLMKRHWLHFEFCCELKMKWYTIHYPVTSWMICMCNRVVVISGEMHIWPWDLVNYTTTPRPSYFISGGSTFSVFECQWGLKINCT